jgi:O-antigen/teichoic acid export membrane protein
LFFVPCSPTMHLATKVAYNTIIQVASKIITTILGLLAVVIMTHYLGPAGFGEYTTIITFLSFFGIMADLGLTLVTVQMISPAGVNEHKILNNLFSLRLFSAVLFLGLAPFVVIFFPYSGSIKTGVAVTLFSFLFIALNQILVGLFQKNLRMDKVSIAETVGRIVLIAGVFIAARGDFGLLGMMWAIVAGSAINFILLFIFSLKYASWKLELDFSLWKEIAKKSWPLALTIIFNLLYLKTDTLILSIMKSQTEVGVYGAAYKVIDVLTMVPFMFAGVILPILTLDWAKGDMDRFKRVLQKSFDLMVILAVPLVVGTQFLAGPVMDLVGGKGYEGSGVILRILIVAAGFVFLSSFLAHVIVAAGAQRKIIWAYFFTAITSVAGYLFFIPRFSYFGAAAVTIYSEAAITFFMVYYVLCYIKFFPRLSIFGKAFLAAAVMGISLLLIPSDYYGNVVFLLLILPAASLIYFSALYLLGGITQKDIKRLLNREIAEEKF